LLVLELSLGRHLDFAAIPDRVDERAVVGFSGKHDRTGLAALEHACARVEAQTAFMLFRAMAFQAMGGKQRAHARLEKLVFGRIELTLGGRHVACGGIRDRRARKQEPGPDPTRKDTAGGKTHPVDLREAGEFDHYLTSDGRRGMSRAASDWRDLDLNPEGQRS